MSNERVRVTRTARRIETWQAYVTVDKDEAGWRALLEEETDELYNSGESGEEETVSIAYEVRDVEANHQVEPVHYADEYGICLSPCDHDQDEHRDRVGACLHCTCKRFTHRMYCDACLAPVRWTGTDASESRTGKTIPGPWVHANG